MQYSLEPSKASKKKKAVKASGVSGFKSSHCHTEEKVTKEHSHHTSDLARLIKIKGQINGIEKMIEDKRYCVDILVQFRYIASEINVAE